MRAFKVVGQLATFTVGVPAVLAISLSVTNERNFKVVKVFAVRAQLRRTFGDRAKSQVVFAVVVVVWPRFFLSSCGYLE